MDQQLIVKNKCTLYNEFLAVAAKINFITIGEQPNVLRMIESLRNIQKASRQISDAYKNDATTLEDFLSIMEKDNK